MRVIKYIIFICFNSLLYIWWLNSELLSNVLKKFHDNWNILMEILPIAFISLIICIFDKNSKESKFLEFSIITLGTIFVSVIYVISAVAIAMSNFN